MSDLAQRVARLQPEPWKHGEFITKGDGDGRGYCPKCDAVIYWIDWDMTGPTEESSTPCPIPDPVDITDKGKA
jgi:hypothetical protein